jgi:hypothetical protein
MFDALHFEQLFQSQEKFKAELLPVLRSTAPEAWSAVVQQTFVKVEVPEIFEFILDKHLIEPNTQIKVLKAENGLLHTIALKKDGGLRVRTYSNKTTIENGQPVPFLPINDLLYTPELILAPNHRHRIQTAPHVTAYFHLNGQQLSGHIVRGYTFQLLHDLHGARLNEAADLFYAIRKLEQIYIHADTDPLYLELREYLEKVSSLLRTQHPDAAKMAPLAIRRGQLALEKIFPNDRWLSLLVTDIEYSWLKTQNNQKASDPVCLNPIDSFASTNTSPTAVSPVDVKPMN